jgi:bacterioferritin (cytochrome b1)
MSINLKKSFKDKNNNDLEALDREKESYREAYTLQKNKLDTMHRKIMDKLKSKLTEAEQFQLEDALRTCAGLAQVMGKNELRFMGVCREINLKTGKGWDVVDNTEES